MSQELINLLNQALKMEYSDIFLYPRHSDLFQNHPFIRELFQNFSQMEVRHADIIAQEISKLGGSPVWDFRLLTGQKSKKDVVDWHLANEHAAIKHYEQCIRAANDKRLKDVLDGIRVEETIHQAALEKLNKWV